MLACCCQRPLHAYGHHPLTAAQRGLSKFWQSLAVSLFCNLWQFLYTVGITTRSSCVTQLQQPYGTGSIGLEAPACGGMGDMLDRQ